MGTPPTVTELKAVAKVKVAEVRVDTAENSSALVRVVVTVIVAMAEGKVELSLELLATSPTNHGIPAPHRNGPHGIWYGAAALAFPHNSLKPAYHNIKNGTNRTSYLPKGKTAPSSRQSAITRVILCLSPRGEMS